MTNHIDELAELYAIGSLDETERAHVEGHVAACAECAERLDQAQQTVAEIAQSQPIVQPSPRLQRRLQQSIRTSARPRVLHIPHWQAISAIAAAFIIALIPSWVAVDRSRTATEARNNDNRAIARLADEPFDQATFMSPKHVPMAAKVLYGPHGDWYYVMVMHPRPNMHVAYMHGRQMEMLGTVAMHGESGTLYLPIKHKMEELALLDGETVVAAARLLF